MGILILSAVLSTVAVLASAAPNYFFLGPSPLPYAYGYGAIPYSAPFQILPPPPPAAPLVAPTPQKTVTKVVDVQEATQFHSQDGRGQFLFGYSIPDQARIESRTSDGTVRGSYSYLDPVGRAITVQYLADDTGYHAASNELPISVPGGLLTTYPHQQKLQHSITKQYAASSPVLVPASVVGELPTPVEESPDVAAAREAHLRAHQAALEAHAAALAAAEAQEGKDGEEPPKGVSPAPVSSGSASEEEDVGEQEEVDEESDSDKSMDESDEGVVVESDALSDNSAGADFSNYDDDQELTYEKDRYPKLQYASQPAYDPQRVTDEENNAVIVTNPEFADSAVSTRIGEGAGAASAGAADSGSGKGAFFYSFRHAVPVHVAIPQLGTAAALVGQHPVFPANRYLGGVLAAPGVLRSLAVDPSPSAGRAISISERASLLGAVPLAAVHDAQVSPSQRGSVKDHQTLPLYVSPPEVEED